MNPSTADRLLPVLLLALTAVTGFVDAVSYLALAAGWPRSQTQRSPSEGADRRGSGPPAGIAADSTLAGGANPAWRRRGSSIALMFAGAAAGAFLLRHSVALPLAVAGTVSGFCALGAGLGGARAAGGSL